MGNSSRPSVVASPRRRYQDTLVARICGSIRQTTTLEFSPESLERNRVAKDVAQPGRHDWSCKLLLLWRLACRTGLGEMDIREL